jgi:hypothetical protein
MLVNPKQDLVSDLRERDLFGSRRLERFVTGLNYNGIPVAAIVWFKISAGLGGLHGWREGCR